MKLSELKLYKMTKSRKHYNGKAQQYLHVELGAMMKLGIVNRIFAVCSAAEEKRDF